MRTIIANISPKRRLSGLARSRHEYRHRRVVGVQLGCCKDVIAQCRYQWRKQLMCAADPIAHRAVTELDTVAGVNGALTMQRNMVRIFPHKDVRQQPWTGQATGDRAAW